MANTLLTVEGKMFETFHLSDLGVENCQLVKASEHRCHKHLEHASSKGAIGARWGLASLSYKLLPKFGLLEVVALGVRNDCMLKAGWLAYMAKALRFK